MTTISVYILVFLDSVNLFSSFVLSSENTMVISSQVKISFNALCIEFCGGKFHWEDSCFCKSSYHAPTYSHKNLHKWKSDLLLKKVIASINSKVLCKHAIIKIRVIIIYLQIPHVPLSSISENEFLNFVTMISVYTCMILDLMGLFITSTF